jgi:diguanylate cyclase (GGDEF)-like protein
MVRGQNRFMTRIAAMAMTPLLACFAYFVLAGGVIYLTDSQSSIAPIWPANAVLLAFALMRPRTQMPVILLAGFIGNGLANMLTREAATAPLLFGASNMVEVAIASLGLKWGDGHRRILSEPITVLHFLCWCGLIAPGISALLGAGTAWYLFGQPFVEALGRWYWADALGLLIFTPFCISLISGDLVAGFREKDARERFEFVGLLAFTALVSWFVFFPALLPMLFVIIVPMMLVSFRSGWLGTKVALAIVAVIGGTATLGGHGPIPRITQDPDQQVYYFQVYIATMLMIQMPVAAALFARQGLVDKLRESEQALRLLAARSPILLLSFDMAGKCERVVGSNSLLLDRASADLIDGSFADISDEGQFELRRAHNAALEYVDQSHTAEFRTVNGNDAWYEAVFRAQFSENERCIGTIATIHDVTQRKNQELSLSRTATTDSLTGLLNRAGFRARLEHALLTARPGALSIAMIDVDRFKLINDNSGHRVGDIVLREIARRISSQVRSSDAVGRLGGDEFVILLDTPNWEMVQDICGRIVTAVSTDVVGLPSGNSLRTAISCGVTRYRSGLTIDEFIHEADVALYEAKRAGRNRVVAA